MKTIAVDCGSSYPVYVGQDLLENSALLTPHIHGTQVLIVTQKVIADFYLQKLLQALPSYQCNVIYLPAGEEFKTLIEWQKIIDALIQHEHHRTTTLIALGGGVVGDMTGFAAACYMRGVNYIQIPTTLMAQVDSAIGGKTAINYGVGKNYLGAIYQPQCVLADVKTLLTLPQREWVSGFAEIIKYGLICDAEFFVWLEKNIAELLQRDPQKIEYCIEKCVSIKANFVKQDEHDHGVRRLLNFGHTLGHALEAAQEYQQLLHGEAVAIGMCFAAHLSLARGYIAENSVERIKKILSTCGLLERMPSISPEKLMQLLKRDKKNKTDHLSFVLLKEIGEAIYVEDENALRVQGVLAKQLMSCVAG